VESAKEEKMIKQYRKKPVVIEAIQFTRNQVEDVYNFTKGELHSVMIPKCLDGVMIGEIDTFEGVFTVTENDYVIKGVKGELCPCKPDIFEMTYDEVL
jgi:hypothetical protein